MLCRDEIIEASWGNRYIILKSFIGKGFGIAQGSFLLVSVLFVH